MIDIYMKYGMVIVAVAVVGIVLAMGYRLIDTAEIPPGAEQDFTGTSASAVVRLLGLCSACTKPGLDSECFMLSVRLTSGNITNASFHGKTSYGGTIINSSRKAMVKISSLDSICIMRRLEDG